MQGDVIGIPSLNMKGAAKMLIRFGRTIPSPPRRGTHSESVPVGAHCGLLHRFFDSSSLLRWVGPWPPRNRPLAPATAVPGQASDRRFPEPTTLVALSRSGLCKNSHEAPLQAWPECRADVRTDSEAVPRETKTQTCVRTRLAPDSWIPPIRRNNFRRPPVTQVSNRSSQDCQWP